MTKDEINNEILSVTLLKKFWEYKYNILIKSFLISVVVGGATFLMPNIYKADVLIIPAGMDKPSSKLSALGRFGGIASLAGINIGGEGDKVKNLAMIVSREFVWKFVRDNNLMSKLFPSKWDFDNKTWAVELDKVPTEWDVYRLFVMNGVLKVNENKNTGLVRLSIEWSDSDFAASWANKYVSDFNNYMRENAVQQSELNLIYLNKQLTKSSVTEINEALYDLISQEQKKAMLANTQKEYAFKILDKAVAPDRKIKPRRLLIVVAVALLAVFLFTMRLFLQERKALVSPTEK